MSEPAPSFQPQPFGRYYLVDKVAVGGMAEVFKARAFSTAASRSCSSSSAF